MPLSSFSVHPTACISIVRLARSLLTLGMHDAGADSKVACDVFILASCLGILATQS